MSKYIKEEMDRDASDYSNFEFRALPRRRPQTDNSKPLFLQKAYLMIENCPSEVGTSFFWELLEFLAFKHAAYC